MTVIFPYTENCCAGNRSRFATNSLRHVSSRTSRGWRSDRIVLARFLNDNDQQKRQRALLEVVDLRWEANITQRRDNVETSQSHNLHVKTEHGMNYCILRQLSGAKANIRDPVRKF